MNIIGHMGFQGIKSIKRSASVNECWTFFERNKNRKPFEVATYTEWEISVLAPGTKPEWILKIHILIYGMGPYTILKSPSIILIKFYKNSINFEYEFEYEF